MVEESRARHVCIMYIDLPLLFRHNDLPWNIRKFLKNQLREFRFDDLSDIHPWSRSAWSHTDLKRLKQGMVAAQVSSIITIVIQEFVKVNAAVKVR